MSLLVVTGPPGAGKSTVARLLVERTDPSVLVEGDTFFGFLATGAIAPWLPASDRQNEIVTQAAGAAAGRFAAEGYDTVYDGVVGAWFLPTFLAATGLAGLDYVVLLPSVDVCLERVRTRVGHGFSDADATRHMHRGFSGADLPDRHVLVDPPAGADAVADLIVAARAGGRLRVDAPRVDPEDARRGGHGARDG